MKVQVFLRGPELAIEPRPSAVKVAAPKKTSIAVPKKAPAARKRKAV